MRERIGKVASCFRKVETVREGAVEIGSDKETEISKTRRRARSQKANR